MYIVVGEAFCIKVSNGRLESREVFIHGLLKPSRTKDWYVRHQKLKATRLKIPDLILSATMLAH